MSEAEALELLDRCLKVLYYRDARSLNKVCNNHSTSFQVLSLKIRIRKEYKTRQSTCGHLVICAKKKKRSRVLKPYSEIDFCMQKLNLYLAFSGGGHLLIGVQSPDL